MASPDGFLIRRTTLLTFVEQEERDHHVSEMGLRPNDAFLARDDTPQETEKSREQSNSVVIDQ